MGGQVLKPRVVVLAAAYVVPMVIMFVLFGLVVVAGVPAVLQAQQTGTELVADSIPAPYRGLIVLAGHRCPEISVALLAAQLRQESGFDPAAVNSDSGARGIAQFLPDSWQQWGTDYDGDGIADPLDPADAIGSEADYLCAIAQQVRGLLADGVVHGDLTDLTLASYNAGPRAVREAGGVPEIAETKAYVRSVRTGMAGFTATGAGAGGTGSVAADSSSSKAIAAARAEIGKPYVFGSTGPDSWDCSSLMQHAWQVAGVQISRTTYSQVESPQLRRIPYGQRRPGDLIYFMMHGAEYDHVGMVIDRSRMIEAPRTGLSVRYQAYDIDYYRSRHPMIMRVVAG